MGRTLISTKVSPFSLSNNKRLPNHVFILLAEALFLFRIFSRPQGIFSKLRLCRETLFFHLIRIFG